MPRPSSLHPPGTLPAPKLSSSPVSWITPGLTPTLLCRAGLRGVTFLLRLEGDEDAPLPALAEAPGGVEAAFPVRRAGNYSCSYRTHPAGAPSEPSAPVTVEEMGEPAWRTAWRRRPREARAASSRETAALAGLWGGTGCGGPPRSAAPAPAPQPGRRPPG